MWAKIGPKTPKIVKIYISQTSGQLIDPWRWMQDLTYYGWSETCISLRQPEISKKYIFFVLWGLYNDKLAWFSIYCETPVVYSWLTPQNDHEDWFNVDIIKYVYPSDNRKCPKMYFFVLLSLIKWSFKSWPTLKFVIVPRNQY